MDTDWRTVKFPLLAVLDTADVKIEGYVFAASGARMLDVLNTKERSFLAVKNATITMRRTGESIHRPFLIVNKEAIVFAWPVELGPYRPELPYESESVADGKDEGSPGGEMG
jgi:hypothetical protein